MTHKEIPSRLSPRGVPSMEWVRGCPSRRTAGKLTAPTRQAETDPDALFRGADQGARIVPTLGQPVCSTCRSRPGPGVRLVWAKNGPSLGLYHPLADDMSIPCECNLPNRDERQHPAGAGVMRRMKGEPCARQPHIRLISGVHVARRTCAATTSSWKCTTDEEYCRDCSTSATWGGHAHGGTVRGGRHGSDRRRGTDDQPDLGGTSNSSGGAFTATVSTLSGPFKALSAFLRLRRRHAHIEPMCKTRPDSSHR